MKHLLLIAMGGAGGALCRHGLVNAINTVSSIKFPLGTLTVNIVGSFCIGIMYVLIVEKVALHPDWRNVVIVGFLGAFTTFSTFSLEAITLLENGQLGNAFAYVLSSVVLCVLAAWLAITLVRMV
jgi:fluoride exporter